MDVADGVLYTCADVVATLSSGRYRGSYNKHSACVVADIDETGGRVEAALTGVGGTQVPSWPAWIRQA
jgi:hypothetical protein